MPVTDSPNFDRATERQNRTGHYLPYISKSRVMEYLKNPRHYWFKYIQGLRGPETYPMFRGTEVHTAVEHYYLNLREQYDPDEGLVDLVQFLPPAEEWAPWVSPYMTHFLVWEYRRLKHCVESGWPEAFPPVGVEAEVWDWRGDDDVPLMGFSDVVYDARSIPGQLFTTGVVVADLKTGNGDKALKYSNDPSGILTELEYYGMLFDEKYDVVGVAGIYPKTETYIVEKPDSNRQHIISQAIQSMTTLGTDMEAYPTNPGPLCAWSSEPGCQSDYYRICHDCRWGTPDGPGPDLFDSQKREM